MPDQPADQPEPVAEPVCGAQATFWPDVEACEAVCTRPPGHGPLPHEDPILGEWTDTELPTTYPPGAEPDDL